MKKHRSEREKREREEGEAKLMRIVEAFKDIERRGEGLGEREAGRLCVRQKKDSC